MFFSIFVKEQAFKMKYLIGIILYSLSLNCIAQNRVVIEPSKEYVQHLNSAKSHKVELIKNDKELNKYIKFDGYFLPNKEVLINLARIKQYYSKFDCKSGF